MTTYAHCADIYVLPEHISGHPDVAAMIGAFFSRSYKPMRERVEELGLDVCEVRSKLAQYVTGYGHESILDMCNVVISIENIPILTAVAIEDSPLFAGQETSTRYCDWSRERFVNPVDVDEHPRLHALVEHAYDLLRSTYKIVQQGALQRILEHNDCADLATRQDLTKEDAVRLAAMRARSFDIARGWLPSGAITRVCWSGRLSHVRAHLRELASHPDHNVCILARRTWAKLHEQYSDAMGSLVIDRVMDEGYSRTRWMPRFLAEAPRLTSCTLLENGNAYGSVDVQNERDVEVLRSLQDRSWLDPIPPKIFCTAPLLTLRGRLDFGSLRDLHRHRRGVRNHMLPSIHANAHPFYHEMSRQFVCVRALYRELRDLVEKMRPHLEVFAEPMREQIVAHVVPLASETSVEYCMDLPQFVYLAERRTTMDVHATLREMMLAAVDQFDCQLVRVHATRTPDPGLGGYVLRRGSQTITINGRDVGEEEKR